MMAIRVLLDHDVPEENINLVSLLMAESGVHTIAYAFPHVKIVTTAVDPEINDKFHVLPGIGNFGDRRGLQEEIFRLKPCYLLGTLGQSQKLPKSLSSLSQSE